jgi:Cof subfamily protein (haloacid dehalogenase superfamily)
MKHMDFKLAAIDIDDTLVGPDKRVSPANAEALRGLQALGCRVVLASGRRHDNMLAFQRELGLEDYVVSCQGAVVRHPRTSEVIHEAFVPTPLAAELTAEGLERGLTVMFWAQDGVFARQRTVWTDRYSADCGDDPVTALDVQSLADAGAPAEKIVWGADPQVIAALTPPLRERLHGRIEITVTDDWFVEFTSRSATKAAGVSAVARAYGIDARQALAFGDGNNDVAMLKWAGLGVAMPHGRPAARAAAKFVAPSGDPETSLARAIHGVLAAAGGRAPHRPDVIVDAA